RFDMFEAEFTHDGDACTFEVILRRLGLDDPALRPIAEIVHDIDLKDGKFGRPEAVGLGALVAGLALAHRDDEERLARGGPMFDALYEHFRRKRRSEGARDAGGGGPGPGRGRPARLHAARPAPVLRPARDVRLRRADRALRLHAARPRRATPLDRARGLQAGPRAGAARAGAARRPARD